MILTQSPIEIPAEEPFRNCKLKRSGYAYALKDIIDKSEGGFTMSIDGRWGAGKTTFVRMWQAYLEQFHYKTVYLNAWENDFCDDAMTSILSEIVNLKKYADKQDFDIQEKVSKGIQSLIDVGVGMLSARIGEKTTERLKAQLSTGVVEFADELDKHNSRKRGIQEFRNELERYIQLITPDKPLVFILDELDRCRPDYAVEMLEKVKHFFSVPGVIFVLAIDKQQLSAAIKGYYGSEEIDAEEYLRRFIDIQYSLPEPDRAAYCAYLYSSYELSQFELYQTDAVNIIKKIAQTQQLTLRQCDKWLTQVRLSFAMFGSPVNDPVVMASLVYLKLFHNQFYTDYSLRRLPIEEVAAGFIRIFRRGIDDEVSRSYSHSFKVLLSKMLYMYTHQNLNGYLDMLTSVGDEKMLKFDVSPFENSDIARRLIGIASDFREQDLSLLGFIPYVELYVSNL